MKKMKTILLVDDDEDDRMMIIEALRGCYTGNVEITQIENGLGLLDVLAGLKACRT
jgi:CheY-like chemotaxis protein